MALCEPSAEDLSKILDPVKENLFFESFLLKRKDTMKFNWSKYWFKLQNTTLYFYTSRESQQTSLRGQYYMSSVQSVRSLDSPDGGFTFEIVMKNGKRKLLCAETEDLRDVWIKLLWKSMQLPGPGRHSSSCTWYDIPEIIQRVSISSSSDNSQLPVSPDTDKDNVFQEAEGSSDSESSCDDLYDVPSGLLVALRPAGDNSCCNPGSDIYDVPRGQADRSASQNGPVVVAMLEETYVTMNEMDLYDTPKLHISGWAPEEERGHVTVIPTASPVSLQKNPTEGSIA
ncbi:uncharacterized protein [Hyperolius riggenbachi]|uniref:uncharacterized protein isoform X1 n=1 Tax=Hyperolius riggenbachi TaxID=752182 RepID=UPI0035A373A9